MNESPELDLLRAVVHLAVNDAIDGKRDAFRWLKNSPIAGMYCDFLGLNQDRVLSGVKDRMRERRLAA